MSDHPVTLDELAALDVEIARIQRNVDYHESELATLRKMLIVTRARQTRLIERYNADAARPL